MNVTHTIHGKILVITPEEKMLDVNNASLFKESVLELIETSRLSPVVLDLHHLQFIDSSGFGTFLSIQRTLNFQNGILKLCHLNPPIHTMFKLYLCIAFLISLKHQMKLFNLFKLINRGSYV